MQPIESCGWLRWGRVRFVPHAKRRCVAPRIPGSSPTCQLLQDVPPARAGGEEDVRCMSVLGHPDNESRRTSCRRKAGLQFAEMSSFKWLLLRNRLQRSDRIAASAKKCCVSDGCTRTRPLRPAVCQFRHGAAKGTKAPCPRTSSRDRSNGSIISPLRLAHMEN